MDKKRLSERDIPNIPIAFIEAKDNNHSVGDAFVFHDRTGKTYTAFSRGIAVDM